VQTAFSGGLLWQQGAEARVLVALRG
jgi:hypothetical protein